MTVAELSTMQVVLFEEWRSLPEKAGVYVVSTERSTLYVGRAQNLHKRWNGHHRFYQFAALGADNICWVETEDFKTVERELIASLSPDLNARPVMPTEGFYGEISKGRLSDIAGN